MNDKTDITVLILRFIFGAIFGGLLSLVAMILMAWLNIETSTDIFRKFAKIQTEYKGGTIWL
jgi:hypothetical protein